MFNHTAAGHQHGGANPGRGPDIGRSDDPCSAVNPRSVFLPYARTNLLAPGSNRRLEVEAIERDLTKVSRMLQPIHVCRKIKLSHGNTGVRQGGAEKMGRIIATRRTDYKVVKWAGRVRNLCHSTALIDMELKKAIEVQFHVRSHSEEQYQFC